MYRDGGQILIWKFKNGNGYLKEFLADKLAEKFCQLPRADFIVSVPMTKRDRRKRGYNQSELLAKALSERVGIDYLRGVLEKVKSVKQQKSLTKKQRAENVKGCFKVKKADEIKGKTVVIADDVLTTGATANEITRILIAAGAKEVYLATAASVEYKIIKEENASDIK